MKVNVQLEQRCYSSPDKCCNVSMNGSRSQCQNLVAQSKARFDYRASNQKNTPDNINHAYEKERRVNVDRQQTTKGGLG